MLHLEGRLVLSPVSPKGVSLEGHEEIILSTNTGIVITVDRLEISTKGHSTCMVVG